MKRTKTLSATEQDIPFVELKQGDSTSFDIRPLHYSVKPNALLEGPHRHNFQELIWIKGGKGRHNIDNVVWEVKPRTFYLIAKGQVHYFIEGIGLKGNVICFTDDFFFSETENIGWDYRATLFNLFTIHQSLKINKGEISKFEEIMNTMSQEYNKKLFGWTQLLRHLLSILLIQLERARRNEFQHNSDLTFHSKIHQAFIDLLEQDYKIQHVVSHYAHMLYVTPRQLSDILHKFSGKTAKCLILDRLCLEAKRYLQHTNTSIKEIAYTLGFHDPSYFGKIFKQVTGLTPKSYRTQL